MIHKKNYLLRFLRFSLRLIFVSLSLYFVFVVIGGYIWVLHPKEVTSNQEELEIYVTSNGFHTDIVIPIRRKSEIDFFKIVSQDSVIASYLEKTNSYKWLSVGWGDKGFYNESYNGNFPSFFACSNAALLPSETLMHIDFFENDLIENKNCKKITLKKEGYQSLLQHITSSFRIVKEAKNKENKKAKFVRLLQKGYSNSDYFFEANGSYHLFYTCNSWTNEGLQKANQKTGRFTPFAQTILYHLD